LSGSRDVGGILYHKMDGAVGVFAGQLVGFPFALLLLRETLTHVLIHRDLEESHRVLAVLYRHRER